MTTFKQSVFLPVKNMYTILQLLLRRHYYRIIFLRRNLIVRYYLTRKEYSITA